MNKARVVFQIIVGIAYILIGFLVINYKSFGAIEIAEGWSYALGILLIVYGAFRIYRGIKDFKSANLS